MRRRRRPGVTVAPADYTERLAMSNTSSLSQRKYGRLLIVGSALVAASAALGLVGLTVGTATLVGVARRRLEQIGVPPSEFARDQLARARAATGAGMTAWRGVPDSAPESDSARLGLREPAS